MNKYIERLYNGIIKENPILVMILAGIMNTGLSFIQGVLL